MFIMIMFPPLVPTRSGSKGQHHIDAISAKKLAPPHEIFSFYELQHVTTNSMP